MAGTGLQEWAYFPVTGVGRKVRGILTILIFVLLCRQEGYMRKILSQKLLMRPQEKQQRTWQEFLESGASVRVSLAADSCCLFFPTVLLHFCALQVCRVMLKSSLVYRSPALFVYFLHSSLFELFLLCFVCRPANAGAGISDHMWVLYLMLSMMLYQDKASFSVFVNNPKLPFKGYLLLTFSTLHEEMFFFLILTTNNIRKDWSIICAGGKKSHWGCNFPTSEVGISASVQ